jgi:hypothetical protein
MRGSSDQKDDPREQGKLKILSSLQGVSVRSPSYPRFGKATQHPSGDQLFGSLFLAGMVC